MKELTQLNKSGGYYKKVIRTFANNLEHIAAGHSLSQLLDGFFCTRKGREIEKEMQNKQTINSKLGGKLLKLVDQFKEIHSAAPINEKRHILSLFSKIFTNEELKEFGFQFSSSQFSNSRKIKSISFKAGSPEYKGRPAISHQAQKILKSFAYQNTSPAANRTIKNPDGSGSPIPVRYVPCCLHCFFELYCKTATQSHWENLSESSFRKYLPKEIKVAKKATDLCPICEEGKKAEKRLNGRFLFSEEEWKILNEKKQIYATHKDYVKKQRASFEAQIKELKIGEAVVLYDFKENIKLGGGPREVSQTFYTKSQRTILGMCLIFKQENEKNEVETKFNYIDFVSEDLTHDAFFVKRCLEKLFSMPIFQNNRFKNLHLWCDGGKHFKNKDIIFLCLQQSNNFNSIELNFFIPYHGKSLCDSHFSIISRIQQAYEKSIDSIDSTEKFIEVMNDSFSRFAQNKKEKKEKRENKKNKTPKRKPKKPKQNTEKKEKKIVSDYSPTVIFVPIQPQNRPESSVIVEMADVELYYNFFFLNNQIRAKVLESDYEYSHIKFKLKDRTTEKVTKTPPVRKEKPEVSKRLISQTNKRLLLQKKPAIAIPPLPYEEEEEVLASGTVPSFPPSILPSFNCLNSSTSLDFSSNSQKRKRNDDEREEDKKRTKYNLEEGEGEENFEGMENSHSGMEWDNY